MGSFDWFPDWRGETCIIVASGPSAKDVPLHLARGRAKVIVINSSWRLAPWADVLYGCDRKWWRVEKGIPRFAGLKVSQDIMCGENREWNVRLVTLDRRRFEIIRDPLGKIGCGREGNHGGFQATNLAVQFGPRRILWVGFDMRVDKGVHWHGAHGARLNNPTKATVEKWRKGLDSLAGWFRKTGIEVINCSTESALTAYPKMTLEEALEIDRVAAVAA